MGLPARSSATENKLVNFGSSAIHKNESTKVCSDLVDISLKLSDYRQDGRGSLFPGSSLQWSQCRWWSCVNKASQCAKTEGNAWNKFNTEHAEAVTSEESVG